MRMQFSMALYSDYELLRHHFSLGKLALNFKKCGSRTSIRRNLSRRYQKSSIGHDGTTGCIGAICQQFSL